MTHLSQKVTVLETRTYTDGSVLYIADKPWIERPCGTSIHLSLSLRRWYDKGKGFVKLQTRTDAQVIVLAAQWASRFV